MQCLKAVGQDIVKASPAQRSTGSTEPNIGPTATLPRLTGCPILLVVNVFFCLSQDATTAVPARYGEGGTEPKLGPTAATPRPVLRCEDNTKALTGPLAKEARDPKLGPTLAMPPHRLVQKYYCFPLPWFYYMFVFCFC